MSSQRVLLGNLFGKKNSMLTFAFVMMSSVEGRQMGVQVRTLPIGVDLLETLVRAKSVNL